MYIVSEFCKTTENMFIDWYNNSAQILEHSGNLGYVREHFITKFLQGFLPSMVKIGTGEIIDGNGGRSHQQDIILYRSDFPVITSQTPINTYLVESVIATIEVKSDLSKKNLIQPFQNSASVKKLECQARVISGNNPDDISKLELQFSPKTFIIGYKGWRDKEFFKNNYSQARAKTLGIVPDCIYYPGDPGICCLYDPILNRSALINEDPFTYFFQHLLRVVLGVVNATAQIPGLSTIFKYDFNKYFSTNRIKAEEI